MVSALLMLLGLLHCLFILFSIVCFPISTKKYRDKTSMLYFAVIQDSENNDNGNCLIVRNHKLSTFTDMSLIR